jgi:hypothetical protein
VAKRWGPSVGVLAGVVYTPPGGRVLHSSVGDYLSRIGSMDAARWQWDGQVVTVGDKPRPRTGGTGTKDYCGVQSNPDARIDCVQMAGAISR